MSGLKVKRTPRPKAQEVGGEREAVERQGGPLTPALRSAAVPVTQQGRGSKSSTSSQPTPHSPLPTSHTPSTFRLFYALKVPSEVAAKLAEAQRALKGNWRAVNPGQMHVTLSYLPAVPPERVPDLIRLGTRLSAPLSPLNVRLRGTGYFPNEGSPRVWFVKVEADGLAELAADLRAGLSELGVGTDDLAFKAHVTLARKKGAAPRVPPLTFDLGWTAPAMTLYRSHLRKTGPIYESQSTFRFRGEVRSASPPPPPAPPQPTTHSPQPPQIQPPQETP